MRRKTSKPQEQSVRIIAGEWRGRRVAFPSVEGLRPSTDRVRETLFNWLMFHTTGARCLDLFCGSGVLGLEALSRGASSLVAVDTSGEVVKQLKENLRILKSDQAQVWHMDALACLDQLSPELPFDLVFIDPPFRKGLLGAVLERLIQRNLLADRARVYVECEKELSNLALPCGLVKIKEQVAGQVAYRLFVFDPSSRSLP